MDLNEGTQLWTKKQNLSEFRLFVKVPNGKSKCHGESIELWWLIVRVKFNRTKVLVSKQFWGQKLSDVFMFSKIWQGLQRIIYASFSKQCWICVDSGESMFAVSNSKVKKFQIPRIIVDPSKIIVRKCICVIFY